jgi:hypothetical protein
MATRGYAGYVSAPLSEKTASQEVRERRQAIWPWVLMPIVVLLVFYALHSFEHAANDAAAHAQSPTSDDPAER